MSKLLSLKQWLTGEEAARFLTASFREPVGEADVLRLALDGHLKLSVNFVNHARARRGVVSNIENAPFIEIPADHFPNIKIPKSRKGELIRVVTGLRLDDEQVLNWDDKILTLDGIYDLPMIGAERLDVEHRCQSLTGGPAVKLTDMEGAFVQDGDGVYFQIQENWDENEFQRGSKAELQAIKAQIRDGEKSEANAAQLLKQHKQDRRNFLSEQKEKPEHLRYYPAGGLPRDSAFVIRPQALRALLEYVGANSLEGARELAPRAEKTYQAMVAVLLDLLLGTTPAGNKQSVFKSQSSIIDAILANHHGVPGLSKRTLEDRFSEANRLLKGQ